MLDELLVRYPGISATKSKAKEICLRGNVKVKNTWFCVLIICPRFPKLEYLTLKVQQLHMFKTITTAANIKPEWTIIELIENLPQLMNSENTSAVNESTTLTTPSSLTQESYFAEIAQLHKPESYQMDLNGNCTRIRFSRFEDYDQHYLELEWLNTWRLSGHSLPECDGVSWPDLFRKCSTLTSLLEQFLKYLEECRPFYENFLDIDELCYVVQPAKPTTKDNWRLFPLRKRVFFKLTIADPFAPIASMSLRILGPTHDVEELRRKYSEGLRDWDAELDIHKNFLRIFDLIFFPMPPQSDTAEEQQFCNICYCYQLERGQIPIVSCDNVHCNLIYHAACLKEWFSTLSECKTFLDVSFGACPFCKAKLSTSFAELMEN